MSNDIDKKLFEQIFGHKFETLANKPVNTTNKEENQIIVKNIEKYKKNLARKKKQDLIIMWSNQAIDVLFLLMLLILFQTLMKKFNLIWFENITNQKMSEWF